MSDWQKIQYRQPKTDDALTDWEDAKFGIGGWLLLSGGLVCAGLLVWGVLQLIF